MTAGPDLMRIDHVYAAVSPRIVAANGIRLAGADGHTYLDAEACNGGSIFGFDPSLLRTAMRSLSNLPAAPSFVETQPRVELAARLRRLFEHGAEDWTGRTIFDTSGAGGIETAVKLCANRIQSHRIFTLAGAYHGRSIYTSSLSGSFRYRQTAGVQEYPVTRLPMCAEGDPDTAAVTELALRYLRDEMWGASATAGYRGRFVRPILLFESFQNVGGGVMVASDFLRALCDEVHSQGGLVIADETYTGLFRTGQLWGHRVSGVRPDIVVACKAFSNAMAPFSAVWAHDEVCDDDVAVPGLQSGTYSSCVTSIAIVHAVLDRVDELGLGYLAGRASWIGTGLAQLAESLAAEFDCVASASVYGCVLRLGLTVAASELRGHLLALPTDRLIVASTGLAKYTALIAPALVVTDADLAAIGDLLRCGLRKVAQ
ncbi:aminotransferase class III-fold pyridoxal phosphate-dependent enzyme [Mycobacteroides abscessus]|uniref:aminotransferase class III-fold pyridoxal phosphate-dependent enzyme n=1 Tax=Mycobacteroides abscessus TaxID=36809 RepID=UPI00210223DC|nr:aminotransferase class III-fold pyridoxal phosphate-dependent enzyme [Mycobacteroides abscessus]